MKAVLFWGDTSDLLYGERAPERDPLEWIRATTTRDQRKAVANYLDSGEQILGYMGYADCRICGDTLGTRDMGRDGLVWPEMASHYVLKHGVWTPEHQEIYERITYIAVG